MPRFSFTNYGVECHFPIIESGSLTIAVLLCDTGDEHIGLLLCPSNDPVQDPHRKKYHAAYGFWSGASSCAESFRLISLGDDLYNLRLRVNGVVKTVTAEWRDIFILGSPPPIAKDVAPSRWCFLLHSIEPVPPFRLPQWLIGRLTRMGFEPLRLDIQSQSGAEKPLAVVAEFADRVTGEAIHIALGTYMQSSGTPAHWAKVQLGYNYPWAAESHDCGEHHVKTWPRWTRDFGDADRTVRLSFSSCKLTPVHTLVVHVELEGNIYDDLKSQKNIELPSRDALKLGTHAVGPYVALQQSPPSQLTTSSNRNLRSTSVSSRNSQRPSNKPRMRPAWR